MWTRTSCRSRSKSSTPKDGFLGEGRFGTDKAGFAAFMRYVKQIAAWPESRVWAVEGANGAGRATAQRLLAAGERVVDVPAKLAARARLLNTGHNRKTDAVDAHSIAMVAVTTAGAEGAGPRTVSSSRSGCCRTATTSCPSVGSRP